MSGILAYDVCRCHGTGCNSKETCLRHLDKAEGGSWVVWSDSLHDTSLKECSFYIPIEAIPFE